MKTDNVITYIPCTEYRESQRKECIELYPKSLLIYADERKFLPLHSMLYKQSSIIDDIMMMVETCPAALQHQATFISFLFISNALMPQPKTIYALNYRTISCAFSGVLLPPCLMFKSVLCGLSPYLVGDIRTRIRALIKCVY
jgi:hypothetical protein